MDACISRRRNRSHGPWCDVVRVQLMLHARLSLQSVVDRQRGDSSRKRSQILGWGGGDGRELLETPVRHCRESVLASEGKPLVGCGVNHEFLRRNTMLFSGKAAR